MSTCSRMAQTPAEIAAVHAFAKAWPPSVRIDAQVFPVEALFAALDAYRDASTHTPAPPPATAAESVALLDALTAARKHDDAGPVLDCWDTEDGDPAEGAARFASDWSHTNHADESRRLWEKVWAAHDAALTAAGQATPSEPVKERGPWTARTEIAEKPFEVFVESDDFTHDVRLYVSGDFRDNEQRLSYAGEIARRLNAAGHSSQGAPTDAD